MSDKTSYETMREMESEVCGYSIKNMDINIEIGDEFKIFNREVSITEFTHTNDAGSRNIMVYFDDNSRMKLGEFIIRLNFAETIEKR